MIPTAPSDPSDPAGRAPASGEPAIAAADARAADARARHLAQREYTRPLVVEAGAGTGKTATLVARVVAWCLGPGWARAAAELHPGTAAAVAERTLQGVVAITFTEAAAAEMAERVAHALRGVAAGEPPTGLDPAVLPPGAAERSQALLGVLDGLEVRTIHSFCARLLQTHALAAGLHPAFRVDAEGEEVREVIEEIVEEALRQGYGEPPDEDLLVLGEAGVGPAELAAAIRLLVDACVPRDALDASPLDAPAVQALVRAAADGIADLADALSPLHGGKGRTNLRDLGASLQEAADELSATPSLAAMSALAQALLADGGSAWDKLRAPGKLTSTEIGLLGEAPPAVEIGARLLPALRFLAALDPEALARVARVLGPLLRATRDRLRARGVLVFGDLLAGAAALLRDQPAVRARLRQDLRQLLVDEFQDTDPLQCEVVGLLALDGPPQERPGLFLVGDPKQSIYGWRSADLAAYEGFVDRVLRAGGERVPLVVNFRSVPAVLDAVQGALAPVMRPRPGRQPAFQPLLACEQLADAAGFCAAGRAAVELWAPWLWEGEGSQRAPAERQRKGHVRVIEADAVARDIRAVHEAGVPWREIAVLFRAGTQLPLLVDALRRHGVPYAVERDRSFFLRREIADVAALIAVIAAPHDQVSLVGWLRSATVGVPDAALLPLWRRGFPGRVAELRGPDPAALAELAAMLADAAREIAALRPPVPGLDGIAGWHHLAADALRRMAACRKALHDEASDRFVALVREHSLVEAAEAGRYLGAWRLANLDRFFRGLQEGLADGGDVQVVLRGLREGLSGTRESEEGRPQEAAEDAVQLMTIHKAKGLGFGHVYLVGLDKESGGGRGTPDQVHDAGAWRLLGQATPGLLAATQRAEEVARAELVRLLYVAMTRARQRLVLCGCFELQPAEVEDPDQVDTLSGLLGAWGAVPGDLGALARSLPAGEQRAVAEGASWVFPGRVEPAGPASGEARVAAHPAPPAGVMEADRAALVAARQAALQRQRRPWTTAASQDAHGRLRQAPAEAEEAPAWPAESSSTDGPLPAPDGSQPPGASALPDVDWQETAMAAGSAVHRALELLDLHDPAGLAAAVQRQVEDLPALVAPFAAGPSAEFAVRRAAALLTRAAGGALLARLHAARDRVVARELPLLVPPDGAAGAAGAAGATGGAGAAGAGAVGAGAVGAGAVGAGAVGAVVGAIDLLLQDADGRLVVIDYKTDEVDEAGLAARADAYASQARRYRQAVQDALAPPLAPRAELWFLALDRAVEVPG